MVISRRKGQLSSTISCKAILVGPNLKTGVFSASDTGSRCLNKLNCFLGFGMLWLCWCVWHAENKQWLTKPNGQSLQGLMSAQEIDLNRYFTEIIKRRLGKKVLVLRFEPAIESLNTLQSKNGVPIIIFPFTLEMLSKLHNCVTTT